MAGAPPRSPGPIRDSGKRRTAPDRLPIGPHDRDAVRDRRGAVGSSIPRVGGRSDAARTAAASAPARPPHPRSRARRASVRTRPSSSDRHARRRNARGSMNWRVVPLVSHHTRRLLRAEAARRRYEMRTTSDSTTTPTRRSRWVWIAIGIVVLAVIGVIAYLVLYSGGNGYGGGGGTGGTGGGGYFMLAFSGDQLRRLRNRVLAKR